MKYRSVISSCLIGLGFLFALFPLQTVAVSNAESEVSINFSQWADESEQENTEPSAVATNEDESSDFGKRHPQTGELINKTLTVLGLLLIISIPIILYKRSKKGEKQ